VKVPHPFLNEAYLPLSAQPELGFPVLKVPNAPFLKSDVALSLHATEPAPSLASLLPGWCRARWRL
jgi:hypothetical protein